MAYMRWIGYVWPIEYYPMAHMYDTWGHVVGKQPCMRDITGDPDSKQPWE